ncbi:hypothetical protein [Micromonospora sp. NBC_01796]|uniref:hypothetical protein n=1 Tax=Micromonospora sp. NBC_01796 TaxID=2975987 RepID=UPI002DDA84D3|nr:hypothetical protein [Micromonospora sp. NBC_01796]WSA83191.1 hypothetical protein OIE47_22565 [Micromonospora sp. NBC_01796]
MRVDWGNVPGWIGSASLLLAFRVFLRDRTAAERAQVDVVGIWWKTEREFRFTGESRVEEFRFKTYVRNGSDLPVEVTYAACEIRTRWLVPDIGQAYLDRDHPQYPGAWSVQPGLRFDQMFIGPIRVPPQETWEADWQNHNVAHLAPNQAVQLEPFVDGVHCVLNWAIVTDNAGRRWLTHHQYGRRARRMRWYTWGGAYLPHSYKGKGARAVNKLWIRVTERSKELSAALVKLVKARLRDS